MLLLVFFGFCFLLVAAAGVSRFLLAIYIFRASQFSHILKLLAGSTEVGLPLLRIAVGAVLSVAIPLVAGLSYAVSGTTWFVDAFGTARTYFWAWVASAFAIGLILGLLLRADAEEHQ